MLFSCVRCSTSASTLMTYSYEDRAVWLEELDREPQEAHGYALCVTHADRMVPPLGWTLTDRRNVTKLFSASASPAEVA